MPLTSATIGNNISLKIPATKLKGKFFFPNYTIKLWICTFSAVLRKPCWKTGKSLTSTQNIFCFKRNLNTVQVKICYQTEREPSLSIDYYVSPFSNYLYHSVWGLTYNGIDLGWDQWWRHDTLLSSSCEDESANNLYIKVHK